LHPIHTKRDEEKREEFKNKIKFYQSKNRPIIYIDESGFSQDSPRLYGYTLKGRRCYGNIDWGKKHRTNVIGALWGQKFLTVSAFDYSINSEIFYAWATQDLIPKLPRKSVLVIDNASFHKQKNFQIEVTKNGHCIEFLPTYSPDLNKIENKWAQAKSIRKKYSCSVNELFQKVIQ